MTLLDDSTRPPASGQFDDADRSALERRTAKLIERLSLAESGPDGAPRLSSRLFARDVRWDESSWASCLAEVEEWLGFDEELPFHSRDLLSRVIARSLQFSATADAFIGAPTGLVLTDAALERLHDLLDRALYRYLRSQEDQVLGQEEEADPGIALVSDEDGLPIESSSDPIAAKAAVWNINEFSSRALRGKLNLSPSYQRGDVWPIADAQLLIESILRGIPLPSVIVLKPQHDPAAPYEVVDGKQRLTSILRFIGSHPDAIRTVKEVGLEHGVDLLTPFQQDYVRFRSMWKTITGEALTAGVEKELYFPFRLGAGLRGALEPLRGKYYSQIRNDTVEVAEERIEIADLFERVTEYKIPVIEYLRASHTQIHEVFNLYNKQGKHLNAEEIRNALFHDLDLMRGVLVASGDSNDLENVAPFLSTRWASIRPLSAALTSLGFGTVRYRRSKVLSWTASLLVNDSRDDTGRARRLSTAAQINSFLRRVQKDPNDALRDAARLRDMFAVLSRAAALVEQMPEAWSPTFKDGGTGAQWQELPLVGTLVAIAAAVTVLGDDIVARMRDARTNLLRATLHEPSWARLEKTQTATQWSYISTIALDTLRLLGIDPHEASVALRGRFGQSGLPALMDVESRPR